MNYLEWKRKLYQKAIQSTTPILGEFELTARCNLNCKMCYVLDANHRDLSTSEWLTIFQQATDAGLLFALLTGGELFLRSDFITLYNSLHDMGVRIALFTNGTHVPQNILDALSIRYPEYIAITLYGASESTYLAVTGKTTKWSELQQNIKRIQQHKINLVLRTIPLRPIYNDLDDIIAFASSQDIPLTYTEYIAPVRNLQDNLESWRLTPSELHDFAHRIASRVTPSSNHESQNTTTKDATCAALRSAYFINHRGDMQPCAMAYTPTQSVLESSVSTVFQELAKTYPSVSNCDECSVCELASDCLQCYARRLHEPGETTNYCPSYLRSLASFKSKEGTL